MRRPRRSEVHAGLRFVAVGAATAGIVVGAQNLTWSADLGPVQRDRLAVERSAVTDARLTCPGPELVGLAGAKDVAGTGTVAAATPPLQGEAAPGSTLAIGADAQPVTAAGMVTRAPLTGTTAITAAGTGSAAPGLVAAQSWSVATEDARGLVSAACGPAATDVWLLAGGSEPGRQERLVLANPGANEVVVDVSVDGAKGPVESATGSGIVVPARGRASVLLDAVAGTESAPAVHVTTTGGAVRATLTDTWLDGTVPAGLDSTTPAAAPAKDQVVPAVAVPPAGEGSSTLRVANPGEGPAVVEVRALGPDGGRPVADGVRTVPAGSVVDLDLGSLAGTSAAIEIRSDVPVVAAVRTLHRAGSAPGDFEWSPAAEPVEGLSGTTLPELEGAKSVLGLVATTTTGRVDVIRIGADGSATTTTVSVPADASTDVDVTGAQAVWVRPASGSGPVRGAVRTSTGTGAAQLATTTPLSPAPLDAPTQRIIALP